MADPELSQCGETRIHQPHGDCPGLDGSEVPNPQGVENW